MTSPAAPTPRPAQGFGTSKAQRWITGAAIVVGMVYLLRRFTEDNPQPRGGTAARIAGHGSPPPTLAHWTIAYATGFMLLALIALPAPELAASLAVLTVTGTLLANGVALANDLGAGLEQPNLETVDQTNARVKANLKAGRPPLYGMPGYGNMVAGQATHDIPIIGTIAGKR